jgi:hypothetical protein
MMTCVLGEEIAYDGSIEAWQREAAQAMREEWGEHADVALEYWARYYQWEHLVTATATMPRLQLEFLLGRKPVTLEEWITEHAQILLGKEPVKFSRTWSAASPERVHNPVPYTPANVQCARATSSTAH